MSVLTGRRAAQHPGVADSCDVCGTSARSNLVRCTQCKTAVHTTCLGLGRHAFPAGHFTCASCVRFESKVAVPNTSAAREVAHQLVNLRAQRVQSSSEATYASGLHRYLRFSFDILELPAYVALPCGPTETIQQSHVELFVSWASTRYKVSTIRSTLSALVHWHKSKGVVADTVSCPKVTQLVDAVERQQGPSGLPVGKVGMSKAILRLLLGFLAQTQGSDPRLEPLRMRDATWLTLGFFGMLRRSELIQLRVGDIVIAVTEPQHVALTIRRSKTDPVGRGQHVVLAARSADGVDILGRVKGWLSQRRAAGATELSPLFPSWSLDTYTFSNIAILTGEALALRLRGYLQQLVRAYPGLNINPLAYGMHSLRRGGVVAAWAAGVDVEKIKSHGRWSSDAVRSYMTADLAIRLQVTTTM